MLFMDYFYSISLKFPYSILIVEYSSLYCFLEILRKEILQSGINNFAYSENVLYVYLMWLFDKKDSPSLSEKVGTFIPLTHSPPIGFYYPQSYLVRFVYISVAKIHILFNNGNRY